MKNNYLLINDDCVSYLSNNNIKVDCVIIDPPYIYNDYSKGNIGFDEKQENIDFIKTISNGFEVNKVLTLLKEKQNKINIFIFCNTLLLPDIINFYKSNNKYQINTLVWKKGGRPFGNTYLHDIEFIVHVRETGSHFNGAYKSRLLEFLSKREFGHPTEKPVKLLAELIRFGSNENDIILDCFAGSGSTGEASLLMDRKFIGIEIEKKYFDIASKRLKNICNQNRLF